MTRSVLVYVEFGGALHRAGACWTMARSGRQSATFEYAPEWLASPVHFALEPALVVGPGPHHTAEGVALFGALSDSAPDRWGRTLIRRAERRRARTEGRTPRTLLEIDYVLGVLDASRLGALRFATEEGGPFLAAGGDQAIPPLVSLPRLLSAADRVASERETDDDLLVLLAPGSSLGGARPKASVFDKRGRLSIAKFPRATDEWSTVRWEAVALALADKAGLVVPARTLHQVSGKPVLLLQRFDRIGARRVPFLSAMSMLGARDHETRSYPEMADALRRWGAAPREDMQALYRRVLFNILISNTDDHLRNHGFLFPTAKGWRLAPAYDLNPMPVDVKPRVLSTEIDLGDATASLEVAFRVAEYFEISLDQARCLAKEVGRAVSTWREEAARAGISAREQDRMATAFDHDDLRQALQ